MIIFIFTIIISSYHHYYYHHKYFREMLKAEIIKQSKR